MKRLILTIALASFCLAGTATAGVSTSSNASTALSSKGDSDCAKARKAGRTCELNFDGDDIDGQRVGGDGDMLVVNEDVGFTSLIRLRTSFRDQIVQSTLDL